MQEAVRGNFGEIANLLIDSGGKICENGNLVNLQESAMAGVVNLRPAAALEFGIEAEWEVNPAELTIMNKLGEGEFGEVFKARHRRPPWMQLAAYVRLVQHMRPSVAPGPAARRPDLPLRAPRRPSTMERTSR